MRRVSLPFLSPGKMSSREPSVTPKSLLLRWKRLVRQITRREIEAQNPPAGLSARHAQHASGVSILGIAMTL
jgi:hypothetical protein